ncbi:MAG: glycosyltransferase family 4 protein [Chloroflexi bacterium]|nr:glycosyltransferase family 4 protein [Chloroflexota bacterium]
MSKRALLVITGAFAYSGGIAASTRLAIRALLDSGYELDIFAFNETPDAANKYAALPGVRYHAGNNAKLGFALMVWWAGLTRRYACAFSDHINVASILAPLAWLRLVRYIVRVHLIEAVAPNPDAQGRLGLRAAWRIHASEFARAEVRKAFPDLQIEVVPLALDPDTHFDLPTLPPTQMNLQAVAGQERALRERVVLLVGRMAAGEQYKGQDVLIRSLPLILERCPDAQLVLAGHGDDYPRLLALAHSLPAAAQERVFMPGYVSADQLETLYRTCAVFAMPSRGEGFGLVYLEAMRWAKPCVASRADAAQFIVEHEQTGLLVDDPQDEREVAAALLRLLTDPALAQAYGQAGYERARRLYSFDQFRARFIEDLT